MILILERDPQSVSAIAAIARKIIIKNYCGRMTTTVSQPQQIAEDLKARECKVLEKIHVIVPITALCSFTLGDIDVLLVGEGPLLKIFQDDRLQHCEKLLENFSIHGIVDKSSREDDSNKDSSRQILVYGGHQLCMFDVCISKERNGPTRSSLRTANVLSGSASDRVITACFVPSTWLKAVNSSSLEATLLTHNNELLQLSLRDDSESQSPPSITPCRLAAGPNILLYSAQIVWQCPNRVLVASGTAFGEVLVWSAESPGGAAFREGVSFISTVLYNFMGHEGSVFGVTFLQCECLSEGDIGPRFVTSCSDDRTIRVWDISSRSRTTRPTGLASNAEDIDDLDLIASSRLVAKVMAYGSRIWGLRFLYSTDDDCPFILSHGEDSTTQLWRVVLASQNARNKEGQLEYVSSFDFHTGKNIWAVDTRKNSDSTWDVWSGGADGQITQYRIDLRRVSLGEDAKVNKIEEVKNQLSTRSGYPPNTGKECEERQKKDHRKIIFESFRGTWQIHRKLTSALPAHPSGTFTGTAIMRQRTPTDDRYDNECHYSENGTFSSIQGSSFTASRCYVYRYSEELNEISVWFVKITASLEADYLFHVVHFDRLDEPGGNVEDSCSKERNGIEANGSHLCNQDLYNARYLFEYGNASVDQWTLRYDVLGPHKDYSAEATYSRCLPALLPWVDPQVSAFIEGAIKHNPSTELDTYRTIESSDSFKTYGWIGSDELLATTDHGVVLLGTLREKSFQPSDTPVKWTRVECLDSLKSYSTMTTVKGKKLAFVGGKDGSVICFSRSFNKMVPIQEAKAGKVSFLSAQCVSFCGPNHQRCTDKSYEVILLIATALTAGSATVYLLNEDFSKDQRSLALPQSFLTTCSCANSAAGLILLGSRHGSLAIYNWLTKGPNEDLMPIKTMLQVHGSETVTAIRFLPCPSYEASKGDESSYIITTGRDSRFAVHRLSLHPDSDPLSLAFETVHIGWPSFGPNVEGLYFNHSTSSLLLWGFRSKHFVVWDEFSQQEIMKVDCEGCHRSWSFTMFNQVENGWGGSFVWTQAGKCMIKRQKEATHKVVQEGGHGREIKAVATTFFTTGDERKNRTAVIATGAEDTVIRIFSIHQDASPLSTSTKRFKCLRILRQHSAGIQQLRWSADGKFLYSAAGFEEFYIWKVTHDIPGFGIGLVASAKAPSVTPSKELRVTDFDVEENSSNDEHGKGVAVQQTMCLAYSDGSFRIFRLSGSQGEGEEKVKLELLYGGSYGQRCLTQIHHLNLHAEKKYIVTALTDGHIAFYDPSEHHNNNNNDNDNDRLHLQLLRAESNASEDNDYKHQPQPSRPPQTHRIHQNAIHRLLSVQVSTHHNLIATAGDDGALGFTILTSPLSPLASSSLSSSNHSSSSSSSLNSLLFQTPPTLIIPKAHAAAVTGLAYLGLHRHQPSSVTSDSGSGKNTTTSKNSSSNVKKMRRSRQEHIFATAGADQMIKLWGIELLLSSNTKLPIGDVEKVKIENKDKDKQLKVRVRKIGKMETSVGDVAGLEYLAEKEEKGKSESVDGDGFGIGEGKGEEEEEGGRGWLVVVGIGMEVFRYGG